VNPMSQGYPHKGGPMGKQKKDTQERVIFRLLGRHSWSGGGGSASHFWEANPYKEVPFSTRGSSRGGGEGVLKDESEEIGGQNKPGSKEGGGLTTSVVFGGRQKGKRSKEKGSGTIRAIKDLTGG